MCGIIGIIGNETVSPEIYDGLLALQHRGQDAAGMATFNGQFHIQKGLGLARDVFRTRDMVRLQGSMGIGHTRYATAGAITFEETQPFYVESPYGLALIHNGNIYNAAELKKELMEKDRRHVNSTSDSEVMLNVLADGFRRYAGDGDDFPAELFAAVKTVYQRSRGAYAVIVMIANKGLLAFRDPYGIRPLVMGQRQRGFQTEYIFASETTMFNSLGFEYVRDVEHGEAIFIDMKHELHSQIIDQREFRPCLFEYVYFARADAMMNRVSVYRARLRMGQNLAEKIKKEHPDLPIDIVIPAPSTANTAALSCAHVLGVRYSEGLVKNQFVGRTFIMPGQSIRKKSIKQKLSPIALEMEGKNVLIVDDSIIRGNTSQQIVSLVREAGAKNVYFASSSPPVRWPCLYGIDMPTRSELIASNKTNEDVRQYIGADVLVYQDLDDLIEAVTRKGDHNIERPCTDCFDGNYPTGDIDEAMLKAFEEERLADKSKSEEARIESERLMF